MELTRRRFLAGALGAGAALGVSGASGMFSASGWLAPAEANEPADEHTACTYHQSHCGGMCPLRCTVRDGRLVMVEPNHCAEDRYETICLKGISEVQHIYGDHRVQSPLKRTGERGANEFEVVSWDEALDDIVARIQEIQAANGKDAVMVTASAEANFPFLAALLGAQTGGNTGIDVGYGNGLDPAIGWGAGYASATGEARDWVNANMVLTMGSNFCESSLPNARLFFEAKEAGTKMVTVDPHFSTTAGKSNQWIPIEPGTDAALLLAMNSVILDEKLYDETFVREHTSFPFLVDTATGQLLRDHAESPEAEEPETGETNPFFVWDQDKNAPVPYTDAVANPALEGTFEHGGRTLTTVWSLLLETQKPHTAAWAAGVTGIGEDSIVQLAREYASGPSCLAIGWGGNDKMSNADVAGHAAAVLVALTGNIGKVGAHVGVFVGGSYNGHTASFGSWELPEELAAGEDEMAAYDMRTQENKVRAWICCGDFVAQHFANMAVTEEWVKKLDLVVSIDPYFTEGAKWADYVLPATTRFENDAKVGNVACGYSQIILQEKVIDPLFEAKTDFWIQKEIAKRLGLENALPESSVELVETMLSTSEEEYVSKLTIDQLIEHNGVWPVEGYEEPRREYTDFAFDTTSGRMDVYYDNLASYGQALPVWEECSEIYADNPLRAQYPLQLSNVRTRFHIHNQFNDALWIQQFGEPFIEVNPTEAAERGIENGDVVRVFNDRGSYKCRVHANEAIRPGSARMWEGATADYLEEGNMQNVTNDVLNERGAELLCGPVIPFSDTLVQIEKA